MDSDTATVLVVDDETHVSDTCCEYLDDQHDVISATSGEEALEKLDRTIDVVLLDRRVPRMAGDEVAMRIQRRNVNPKIIVVTAVNPDLDLLHLEFSEYLVKPVSRAEMTDAVDRMIAQAELEAQLQRMLQLASKLSVLEDKLDLDELEKSEQHERLTAEFRDCKQALTSFEEQQDYYSEAVLSKLGGALEGDGRT